MSPRDTDFIETEARFGAHNYHPLGVILSRGEGVWVWDTQGNRYLDCLSAYSAVNQGHCHPKILAAMVEQAGRLTLTSRAFHNDQLASFYEQIAELTSIFGSRQNVAQWNSRNRPAGSLSNSQ